MLKEQFLKMNKTRKRLFAGALSVALISTSLNIGTYVAEGADDKNGKVITAFEELPENIAYQYLPIGSEEFEIEFPDELNVTIYSNKGEEEEEKEEKEEEKEEEESRETEEQESSEETGETEEPEDSEESKETEESEEPGEKEEPEEKGDEDQATEESGSEETPEAPAASEPAGTEEPVNNGNETTGTEETPEVPASEGTDNSDNAAAPEEAAPSAPEEGNGEEPAPEEGEPVAEVIKDLFGPVTVYAGELEELSAGREETLKGVVWRLNKDESQYSRFQAVRAGDVFVYEPLIKAFGLKSDVPLPKIHVTITEEDGSYTEQESPVPEEEETLVSENEAEAPEEEESVSENSAEETVSENEAEETVSEDEIPEAFDQMMIVGGVRIRVEAPEGVFPAGSTMKAERLSDSDEEKVKTVLENKEENGSAETLSFDITIFDADGNEIQPDLSFGTPAVTFENVGIDEADEEEGEQKISVYHLDNDLSNAEELSADIDTAEGSVTVGAEHFSVYTILRDGGSGVSTVNATYGDIKVECSNGTFEVAYTEATNPKIIKIDFSTSGAGSYALIDLSMANGKKYTSNYCIEIFGKKGSEYANVTLNKVDIRYDGMIFPLVIDKLGKLNLTLDNANLMSSEGMASYRVGVNTVMYLEKGTSQMGFGLCPGIIVKNDLTIRSRGSSSDCRLNLKNKGGSPIIMPLGSSEKAPVILDSGTVQLESLDNTFIGVPTKIEFYLNGGSLIMPTNLKASRFSAADSKDTFTINGGTHILHKDFIGGDDNTKLANDAVRINGGSVRIDGAPNGHMLCGSHLLLHVLDFGSSNKNTLITGLFAEKKGNKELPKAANQVKFADYGTNDTYTDPSGKAYVWINEGESLSDTSRNNLFAATLTPEKKYVLKKSAAMPISPRIDGVDNNELAPYNPATDIILDTANMSTGTGSPNKLIERTTLNGSSGLKPCTTEFYSNIFRDINWSLSEDYGDRCYFAVNGTGKYKDNADIKMANRDGLDLVIAKSGVYKLKAVISDGVTTVSKEFTIDNTQFVNDIFCYMKSKPKISNLSLVTGQKYDIKYSQYYSGDMPDNTIGISADPEDSNNKDLDIRITKADGTAISEPLEAVISKSATGNLINGITFKAPGEYKITATAKDRNTVTETFNISVASGGINITAENYPYDGNLFSTNPAKLKVLKGGEDKTDTALYRILDVSSKAVQDSNGNYYLPDDVNGTTLPQEYIVSLNGIEAKQLKGFNTVFSPGAYLVWCECGQNDPMACFTGFVVKQANLTFTLGGDKNLKWHDIYYSGKRFSDNEAGLKALVKNGGVYENVTTSEDTKYSFLDISYQFKWTGEVFTHDKKTAIAAGDFSSLNLSGFGEGKPLSKCTEKADIGVYAIKCERAGVSMYCVLEVRYAPLGFNTMDCSYSNDTFWNINDQWLDRDIHLAKGVPMSANEIKESLFTLAKLDDAFVIKNDDGTIDLPDKVRKGQLFQFNNTNPESFFKDDSKITYPSGKVQGGAWLVRCEYKYKDSSNNDVIGIGYSAFVVRKKPLSKAGITFTPYSGPYDGKEHPAVTVEDLPADLKVKDLIFTVTGKDTNVKSEGIIPTISKVGDYNLTITAGGNSMYEGSVEFTAKDKKGPKITIKSIKSSDISIPLLSDEWYTGQAHEPSLVITDHGVVIDPANNTNIVVNSGDSNTNSRYYTLQYEKDYSLSYENNVNAGTATITITGKGNYTDSTEVNFKIKQYTGTVVPLYDGEENIASWYNGKVAVSAKDYLVSDNPEGPFEESFEVTGNTKGVYKDLYFKYVGDKDKDYYEAIIPKKVGPFNFSKGNPTGTIKVYGKTWKELQSKEKIAAYTNSAKKLEVTITASDSATPAGLKSVEYFITNKCYTAENSLEKASKGKWETYKEKSKPGLSKNSLNYSYARITDNAGSITYLSTQGIWYDTTLPKVKSVKVSAEDKKADITVKGEDNESGIRYYYTMVLKKNETKPDKDAVKEKGKKNEKDGSFTIEGLTAKSDYVAYSVIEDKAGNLSDVKSTKFTSKEEKKEEEKKSGSGSGSQAGASKAGAGKTALGDSNSKKRGVGAEKTVSGDENPETVIKNKVPYIDDATEGILTGKEKTSGWDKILNEANGASEPSEIHIDMNGATVVPSFVLNSIEGKDVTYYFEMGSDIIWAVNGLSFEDKLDRDIDFRVKTDTKNIPSKLVNEIADVYPHKNLTLSHDGDFGFSAILSINMGEDNEEMYANLYFFNEAEGSLEFVDSAPIDGNGNTQFEFKHASDYTVILRGDALTEESAQALTNNQSSGNDDDLVVSDAASPKKASHLWLLLLTILSLILCGFILFMPDKRREEHL